MRTTHRLITCVSVLSLVSSALPAAAQVVEGYPLPLRPGAPRSWEDEGTWNTGDDFAISPNGNVQQRMALFTWASPSAAGLAIEIALNYNSADSYRQLGVGYGVRLGAAARLVVGDDGRLTLEEGDGTPWAFTPDGDGYLSEPLNTDVLSSEPGRWVIAMRGGYRRIFEQPNGGAWVETARIDRTGDALVFTYDPSDRLTVVTDSAGRSAVFTWQGAFLEQIADPEGRVFHLFYEAGGLRRVEGPAAAGDVPVLRLAYDESRQHLVVARTNWIGAITGVFSYRPDRRVSGVGFEDGTWNRVDYDEGQVAITDSLGRTRTLAYHDGAVIEAVDADGLRRVFARDERRRPVQVIGPGGRISTFAYDDADDIVAFMDELGDLTTYLYDDRHNPISVLTARGHLVLRSYNTLDQLTSVTNPLGERTDYTYDAAGNLTTITDDLGIVRFAATYDTLGHRLTETTEAGTTSYTYDTYGNLIAETSPDGLTMSRTVTPLGITLSVTDVAGAVLQVTNDELGRPVHVQLPQGGTRALGWDFENRLIAREDRDGPIPQSIAVTFGPTGEPDTIQVNGTTVQTRGPELATLPEPAAAACTPSCGARCGTALPDTCGGTIDCTCAPGTTCNPSGFCALAGGAP